MSTTPLTPDDLAREVLRLARSTLLVNLRFLDLALGQLQPVPTDGPPATDGQHLYYNVRQLLRAYRAERSRPVRDCLHMVLHCAFLHTAVRSLRDRELWDLSCDIAVECAITGLHLPSAAADREARQAPVMARLTKAVHLLTAERIYRHYQEHRPSPEELERLRELFAADDHSLWYRLPVPEEAPEDQEEDESQPSPQDELDRIWQEIAERMKTDLETFSRQQGEEAAVLVQNLRAVTREKYDYSAFLRKFAVMGETPNTSDDEFDYMFYTYGMKLLGNKPLIEPLESREAKRVREIAVAIDTSGSVSGDRVQAFVQKTYNILQKEESFFRKINLHMIQCDAKVQEDVKITCREDFDRYLSSMELKGFGATDFRPVFSYVEDLRRAGEFTDLRGLIYFTDGFGVFPERKPDYPTAFVFVNDEDQCPEVPPWAIRLVLESNEL